MDQQDDVACRRAFKFDQLCALNFDQGLSYAAAAPGARPGLILFVQTFGDLANFNPHLHVLAADGVFGAGGTFIALPAVPEALLAEGFRRAVLEFLSANDALSEDLCAKMLGWQHCGGFPAHNQVRVAAEDREGRMKLAGYMIRAPMSLEKMSYEAATGKLICVQTVFSMQGLA